MARAAPAGSLGLPSSLGYWRSSRVGRCDHESVMILDGGDNLNIQICGPGVQALEGGRPAAEATGTPGGKAAAPVGLGPGARRPSAARAGGPSVTVRQLVQDAPGSVRHLTLREILLLSLCFKEGCCDSNLNH